MASQWPFIPTSIPCSLVAKADAKSGHQATQFGRALLELNIGILCANSSQAKGRVERKNRTLQDRLVKEMRLDGVTGMQAGNDWLPGYILRHNRQFARTPARPAPTATRLLCGENDA